MITNLLTKFKKMFFSLVISSKSEERVILKKQVLVFISSSNALDERKVLF
jgi:hypothetical protein